ncbi:MAG: leucine-rich repeat domain-containing protein [Kiritimatiellae bacterium]|nr:leucine-rich repeat domain-containing protein [Kiritimatiellia bacterium]
MARQTLARRMATALAAATLLAATARAQTPLEVSTANLPLGAIGTPYSATLSATGGTPPYAWSLVSAGPHSATMAEPGTFEFDEYDPDPAWSYPGHSWYSGGLDVPLPFAFPFFGAVYTNVRANANGTLSFTDAGVSDQPYDDWTFTHHPMIAVFWPELGDGMPNSSMPTSLTPGDLWLQSSADEVTILWLHSQQNFSLDSYDEWGEPYSTSLSATYSATLRADGTIVMKYSTENESWDPNYFLSGSAALSAGDGSTTVWGEVTAGTDTTYTPPALPAGIECTSGGVIQGTPTAAGEYPLAAIVTDADGSMASRTLVLGIAGDGLAWDEQGKWTYTVADGVATVTSGPTNGAIVVPAALAGTPVGAIGASAFSRCTSLTSITLPDSVTTIGLSAFNGCTALTNATLGSGLTSLGNYAFNECSRLPSVTVPDGVTTIPQYAFASCSALTNAIFGPNVTRIDHFAFQYCRALSSVSLPASLGRIGQYAFNYCSSLASIDFPASLGTIDQYAFSASGLRDLFVPGTVTNLASRAFYDAKNLTNVVFGAGTTSIPWGIFDYCTGLASVTIPEGVTSIGSIAFRGCSALPAVEFPSTLTTLSERAFDECKKLGSVSIPNSVTSLGANAFRKCSALTNAVVGTGVTAIPAGLFDSCGALSSVTLPPGVASIGDSAFAFCSSLAAPPSFDGMTSIGSYAFRGCSFTDVTVPASVTNLGYYVFSSCASLTNAVLGNGISAVPTYTFMGCSALSSVTLPANTATIGEGAFYNCTALAEIELPATVATIGKDTFKNCSSLAEIDLPAAVTTIAANAFAGCSGLTVVRTPSLTDWLGISFANAAANPLTYAHRLVIGGAELDNLVIPDGVIAIRPHAFSGATGLASVAFGADVTSIGAGAFANCTGLTEVSIPDTVATLGASAFSGCTALVRAEVPAAWWGTAIVDGAGFPAACTVVYRGMEPLEMVTASLPPAIVGTPYQTTLSASGGTTPYAWTVAVPAVYAESVSESSTYEGPDWEEDPAVDEDWYYGASYSVALPFAFPFFGKYHSNVCVNANGLLSFGRETPYWDTSLPVISAFGADFTSRESWSGRICVFTNANEVTAFWQGSWMEEWAWDSYSVEFSATLRPDGSVTLKYGVVDNPNWDTCPTIGIGDGSGNDVHSSQSDSEPPSEGTEIVFSLPPWPAGLSWTSAGLLQGTPETAGAYQLVATVADASGVALTNTFELVVAGHSAADATSTTPVPVPHAWIAENAPGILAACNGDFEAAALACAPIGRPVWQCWLTGADTAAGGTDFTAAFEVAPDGTWTVSWSPDLNDGLAVPVRAYHVLAKQTPADADWTDVTDAPSLPATSWRFFRVSVSLP